MSRVYNTFRDHVYDPYKVDYKSAIESMMNVKNLFDYLENCGIMDKQDYESIYREIWDVVFKNRQLGLYKVNNDLNDAN